MHRLAAITPPLLAVLQVGRTQSVATVTITSSAAASVTAAQAPTGSASPQYTNQEDLRTSVLNSTNFYRYEHSASYIAWNDSLASYASNWANKCQWEHSHGAPGENLARGYPDVTSSVDAWGNERALYNFNTPTGFTEATGHFTQLVWQATQSVGCAAVNCNGRNGLDGWYLVCEYWPPGNVEWTGPGGVNTLFKQNVQPERSAGSQGFNELSATAGATGVTGWATGTLVPTASPSSSNVAVSGKESGQNRLFALAIGCLGLTWML